MRKIIGGKAYDTETATEIGHTWNGLGSSDFRHTTERLQKTPKGSYFLWGIGGPLSKYGQSNGRESWGSKTIIPMTADAARQWAENNLTAEEYEAEFGTAEPA